MKLSINNKHILKYMKLAKLIGEESNPCYSRKIGVVIINPKTNSIISTGYNGPPSGTPHTDEPSYLKMIYNKLLTKKEKKSLEIVRVTNDREFSDNYANCKVCPRRILNIDSGKRLELCSCAHAEANALVNASKNNSSTQDCYMFMSCGIPCIECAKLIINAGISNIICLKDRPDYSPQSRWLFNKAGIKIKEMKIENK